MLVREFITPDSPLGGGKHVRWVSRGEQAVATIEVDADSLMWLIDHLPKGDEATKELEKIAASIPDGQ